jgi:hypothetical protein
MPSTSSEYAFHYCECKRILRGYSEFKRHVKKSRLKKLECKLKLRFWYCHPHKTELLESATSNDHPKECRCIKTTVEKLHKRFTEQQIQDFITATCAESDFEMDQQDAPNLGVQEPMQQNVQQIPPQAEELLEIVDLDIRNANRALEDGLNIIQELLDDGMLGAGNLVMANDLVTPPASPH